ncbi:MAG: FecR domain-containing protein, partial [Chthoniobacterales bacterium]|nr:FecR domain-containing protein [Chthoniobacterales bacterium]
MRALLTPALLVASVVWSSAAGLNQATVTKIVNNVEVIPPGAQAQAATLGEVISGSTGVRTGSGSRAQLTFADNTLTRLGSNTLFSFERGTRQLDLEQGAILLQVPKDAGGATIRSAPVTAAITGTTVMMEHSPGNPGIVKIIVLEGTVRVSLTGHLGESVLVGPGQMISVAADARRLPDPMTVDIKRILKTSKLIKDGDLASYGLILETVTDQEAQLRDGTLGEADGVLPTPVHDNPATQAAGVMDNLINRHDTVQQPPPPPPPVSYTHL